MITAIPIEAFRAVTVPEHCEATPVVKRVSDQMPTEVTSADADKVLTGGTSHLYEDVIGSPVTRR
jgi:hypothetical protein